MFSFFSSLHFEKIALSQKENNSAYMALLLGKCLYKAASVIFDFSARRAVVTFDIFLSSSKLAKDSRMSEDVFKAAYPNWERFVEIKKTLDPSNTFVSHQSMRLGLTQ